MNLQVGPRREHRGTDFTTRPTWAEAADCLSFDCFISASFPGLQMQLKNPHWNASKSHIRILSKFWV